MDQLGTKKNSTEVERNLGNITILKDWYIENEKKHYELYLG